MKGTLKCVRKLQKRENPENRKEASKQACNKNSQQIKEAAKQAYRKQKRGL